LEGLFETIGVEGTELCSACLTGDYPTPVPLPANIPVSRRVT
jgi:glutamine phosphoribosylpyrophosphate amidotransferase